MPTLTTLPLPPGEGDGLPGLVIDVYGPAAVMKLDGEGAAAFYDVQGLASWVMGSVLTPRHSSGEQAPCVFLKYR